MRSTCHHHQNHLQLLQTSLARNRIFWVSLMIICIRWRLSSYTTQQPSVVYAYKASGLEFQHNPAFVLDSPSPNPPIYLAAALTLARDLRTSKRACLRSLRTLKRSKSVSARRRSFWARFLAQADSCHLASIPAFSQAALTAPERAPRGSFSRTSGVRMRRARAIDWRGTAVLESVEGPSIRTFMCC